MKANVIGNLILSIVAGAQDTIFNVIIAPLLVLVHGALSVVPGGATIIGVVDRWIEKSSDFWPPNGSKVEAKKGGSK